MGTCHEKPSDAHDISDISVEITERSEDVQETDGHINI